jgi:ribosomal protein L11 methyltransferase
VVANILANPLKLLAPLLASHTRRGGLIALSGLLVHQHREMADIFSPWFEMGEPVADDGWLCLPGTRR